MENIRGNKPVNAIHSVDGLKDEGITLREHFAGLAMAGLLSCDLSFTYEELSEGAVKQADALLKELDK